MNILKKIASISKREQASKEPLVSLADLYERLNVLEELGREHETVLKRIERKVYREEEKAKQAIEQTNQQPFLPGTPPAGGLSIRDILANLGPGDTLPPGINL
jgi:hypothetical protein